jgi:hypothetical protein
MKPQYLSNVVVFLALSFILIFSSVNHATESSSYEKVDMNIDINKEDKKVGIKRLELIDKTLSQNLIDRKRGIVQKIEKDYNQKTTSILDSIIPPFFGTKVFTHLDVNYFSPQFSSQIETSQKVNISIILTQDGLNRWAGENESDQKSINKIKQLIGNSIKVPIENISVLVAN